MHIKDISLKVKILIISIVAILILGTAVAILYVQDIHVQALQSIVEKSRAVVLTAESTREEMADKLDKGIIKDYVSIKGMSDDFEEQKKLLLEAVPVLTAIDAVRMNEEESNYEFLVPKISPRNPANEPQGYAREILLFFQDKQYDRAKITEDGSIIKYLDKDEAIIVENDHIHFFRPIVLTKHCMPCHGEPAYPGELDFVGQEKEGWKIGEVHGAFEIISSLEDVKKTENIAVVKIVVATGGILLILSFIIWFVIKKVTRPLHSYIENYEMASNGDLTVKAMEDSRDEIGILSSFFNQFMETLRSMIENIKGMTGKTRDLSVSLAAAAEETMASLEEMRANTEHMKGRIDHLDGEIGSSTTSARDIKGYISQLGGMIEEQAAAVNESSASIEEMSSNIKSIARTVKEKEQLTSSLQNTAANGEEEMGAMVDLISQVADAADNIMDMITSIQSIADQTNLLAMNAAIEAAHAGEAGRGFAVVADEIRKLAENSGESARSITYSLQEITGIINSAKEVSGKTGTMFETIVSGIKQVASSMIEMRHSTDELSTGGSQILQALGALITITEDVKEASGVMNTRVEGIVGSMGNVNQISAETKNGMDEMSIGIQEIFKAAENITEVGAENRDSVEHLENIVKKFKV